MSYVLTGIAFVVLTVAVVVWRVFERGRDIASAPERALVPPESPALAISSGAGDLRGTGPQDDGITAERVWGLFLIIITYTQI